MVYLGIFQFMEEEAAILMAAAGIGDGIAPLIGKQYGRHFYHVPFSTKKTMEGSLVGVFLGTVAGCYLYPYWLGMDFRPLRIVLALSGIAAVVEGTSPGNMDNIMIPLVMHFSIDRVDNWLVELA
jgi:dolichol kinase